MSTVEFDWNGLPEETEAPRPQYKRGANYDENSIPEVIRTKVEVSYAKNHDGGKLTKSVQRFPSEEMAATFVKLARKYAQNRLAGQITLRAKQVGTEVTYTAKPLEVRAPKKASTDKPPKKSEKTEK